MLWRKLKQGREIWSTGRAIEMLKRKVISEQWLEGRDKLT
jgi:hypothetical protein